MTGDNNLTKKLGLLAESSSQSPYVRKKTALQVALDELTSLPREEMLRRIDPKQAGANIERFFACDKNKDCHNHSDDTQDRVSRAIEAYRRFDAERNSPALFTGKSYSSNHPELEVVEISGAIKWFDPSKGYGFIVDDEGGPDVLLHVTCLRAGGYQTAYEGARVHCEVIRRPKGSQAFRILSMNDDTSIHPSQLPQQVHVFVVAESDWELAVVKWFNRARGFGFLSRGDGTADIFIQMETLRRFGFDELRPGQTIEVRWGFGSKGVMAAELRPAPIPNERKN
jgi:CspA family cold shock protein